jgi:hypothetical protein
MSWIVKVKEKRGGDETKGVKQAFCESIDILWFKESCPKNKHLRCTTSRVFDNYPYTKP